MRIALAQLNPTVGDVRGNAELVRQAALRAQESGAELLVCSELVLCGYPPKDLLLRAGFAAGCDRAVRELASVIPPELGVIVGHPTVQGLREGRIANGASLLHEGRVVATIHKLLLPNYDVFDEHRYFRPASETAPIEFRGLRLGVHICEDAWWGEPSTFYHDEPLSRPNPIAELARQGVDVFINLSASPFELTKPDRRQTIVTRHVRAHQRPFLFVNQVGGNDDLVFDGHSLVVDAQARVVERLASFATDFRIVDLDVLPSEPAPFDHPRERLILDALTLGLQDYMRKSGFTDCVLGLSGGIDSALAACVAARAAGPAHVHGLMMPSRYSTPHSVADAEALAANLGLDAQVVPIDAVHRAYEALPTIGGDLTSESAGLADQNLQARIRGAMVMTRSNRHGWIALATGNKSELAVGYCTLYGDMAGGFAVLSDLLKRDVYAVSRYVNKSAGREVIPAGTLSKPPSAELAPDQFDQDSLPPYPVLDAILEGLVEREESVTFLSQFYPPETVRWVAQKLDRNEFKRRQMPPGIKLSQRAFGTGRRMPMAARVDVE
ncbi:MAG: NAD+ synthase [Planctomyces sp.]|nr:NAD+ synthase [Planctomyces sp.]